ncbi:hypothetical protein HO173_009446 [Letharia columbiana]|uniref:Uncharacterized protein n=1 Tax=Letharia columbiana TaxID=112416 RepID=A0A8H6L1V2_9LECA|nr:uncharacterized protein HO173_009446 [Letharia columbiana]KAF6232341.1 hypothetical protein HO173_009446 [Letharia columbiana]
MLTPSPFSFSSRSRSARTCLRLPKKSISTKLAANSGPKAQNVQTGNGDLCFLTDTPVDEVLKTFQEQKVDVRQFLVLRYDVESYLGERARD